MRKYTTLIVLGVIVAMFGLGWLIYMFFAYVGLEPRRETALGIVTSEHSFDTAAIQQAIADDQSDIFHLEWNDDGKKPTPLPTEAPPDPNTRLPDWTESDFMRIVMAFAKLTGKDIADANLFQIIFNTDCQHANAGMQDMTFGFFRDISERGSRYRTYLRQFITIAPQSNRLRWQEIKLSEVVREHESLDRHTTHLSAEDALQIAENLGGSSFRSEKNNECLIFGVITEGNSNDEWLVEYKKNKVPFTPLLTVFIDPQTGQGRVVTP